MKERKQKNTQSLQSFWKIGFVVSGKRLPLVIIVSALVSFGIIVWVAVTYGLLAMLTLWAKQGLRLLVVSLGKLNAKALIAVGVKRAFNDFIVTPQMQKRILRHLMPAIIARKLHIWRRSGSKVGYVLGGIGSILTAIVMVIIQGWALIFTIAGLLLTQFATIFGFRSLWGLIGGAIFWLRASPLSILIHFFVYSYILDWVIKKTPESTRKRFSSSVRKAIEGIILAERKIDKLLGLHLEERIKKLAERIMPAEAKKERARANLKESLVRKKQKQKEKQQPDGRITRFRSSDKAISEHYRHRRGLNSRFARVFFYLY